MTNDLDSDWLKHRWQIAKDMSGSPLPLPQYIDLQLVSNEAAGVVFVNRVRLDWETAFARAYKIQVATALRTPFRSGIDRLLGGAAEAAANEWTTIYEELSGSASSSRHQHIVHDINLLRTESQRTSAQQMIAKLIPSAASAPALASGVGIGYPARYIRLWLIENGAPWGSSLWRFEVYGR